MIIDFILTLYFYEGFLFATLSNFVLALLVWPFPFLKKVLHRSLAFAGQYLLFLSGCRLRTLNSPAGTRGKACLILSNHQSLFDILVIFALFHDVQFKWIIKKELFYVPFFGFDLWAAGYVNLDRQKGRKAFRAIQRAIRYIAEGFSIVIFPEGTRSLSDTIQEFKAGSIMIALHSGAPVLPVVLKNTFHIKSKHSFLIRPLPILVKFLPPVETGGLAKNAQKEILDRIHQAMLQEYRMM